MDVYLGEHDVREFETGEIKVPVSKLVLHRGYNNKTFSNDIALVKLRRIVRFTDKIAPVPLPNGRYSDIGQSGVVTGWVIK